MLNFIEKNKWIFIIFLISLILCILTFFTFIDVGFLKLSQINLQSLLIVDLILVILFFAIILIQIFKLFKSKNTQGMGFKANLRYITFFSTAILLPSILIFCWFTKIF